MLVAILCALADVLFEVYCYVPETIHGLVVQIKCITFHLVDVLLVLLWISFVLVLQYMMQHLGLEDSFALDA